METFLNVEEPYKQQNKGKWSGCLRRVLLTLSLGQFKTKLYYGNQNQHSSIYGGIISIICGLIVAVYASVVLWDTIIKRDSYTFSEEIKTLDRSLDFTVSDYIEQAMNSNITILYEPLNGTDPMICGDIKITFMNE